MLCLTVLLFKKGKSSPIGQADYSNYRHLSYVYEEATVSLTLVFALLSDGDQAAGRRCEDCVTVDAQDAARQVADQARNSLSSLLALTRG